MTDTARERKPLTASGWLTAWTSLDVIPNPGTVWISRAVILCFAVAMFAATWAVWPNLVVDCGRELYVPAAMAQGKRLYRDVWYPYGPLAPALNAALFTLFGSSLNTLYFTGLAVFTGSALVLHSIALRFMPPVAALVCGLGFLAPGFHSFIFNDILPYSCAATFGALLCLLTLLFLLRHLECRPAPNLILAGLFAGLAVVSKFELLLPCAIGIALALLLGQRRIHDVPLLLPGVAVVGGTYGWLVHEYGLDFLIHANWMSASGSYFMRQYGSHWLQRTGLRFVPSEIAELAGLAVLAMSVWWILASLLRSKLWFLTPVGVFFILFLVSLAIHVVPSLAVRPFYEGESLSNLVTDLIGELVFPGGMYLIVFAVGAFLAIESTRHRRALPAAPIVTIAMGLLLALKVMMEIRPAGYALFSSSILFLVFIAILWWLIDGAHRREQLHRQSVAVAAFFSIYALFFARMAVALYYNEARLPLIHTPVGDVRSTPENVTLMTRFLPVVQQAKNRGQRVLLLPELTGLYFIAGIESPSRYEMINPGTLEPGTYTQIYLRELERNHPDLIILSNRRTAEYGVNYFGLDYDQEVMAWIESRYHVTGEIGHFERREGAPLAAIIYTPKN